MRDNNEDWTILAEFFADPDDAAAAEARALARRKRKQTQRTNRARFDREFKRRAALTARRVGVFNRIPTRFCVVISLSNDWTPGEKTTGDRVFSCEVLPSYPGFDWCEGCGHDELYYFEREIDPDDANALDVLLDWFNEFEELIAHPREAVRVGGVGEVVWCGGCDRDAVAEWSRNTHSR
jgi:hypothetical protein